MEVTFINDGKDGVMNSKSVRVVAVLILIEVLLRFQTAIKSRKRKSLSLSTLMWLILKHLISPSKHLHLLIHSLPVTSCPHTPCEVVYDKSHLHIISAEKPHLFVREGRVWIKFFFQTLVGTLLGDISMTCVMITQASCML